MENIIMDFLKEHKKSKIALSQMESLFPGDIQYEDFARAVEKLENEGILRPVKSHGTNKKRIELFNTYTVMKRNLRKELDEEIKMYTLNVHEDISLDKYFELGEGEWRKDRPWIEKVDMYLKKHGFPETEIFIPELSLKLTGDEKWIDEKYGKKLLSRIGIWDDLKPCSYPDPLMFSVNPSRLGGKSHIHMVVENKTTYHVMSEFLGETIFTSLIYGAGWKIASNIHMAKRQMGIEDNESEFYYFGDLDFEGVSIWHDLFERHGVKLAAPFYKRLICKRHYAGKQNQIKNESALEEFAGNFPKGEREKILRILNEGCYCPQEALSGEELKDIWVTKLLR